MGSGTGGPTDRKALYIVILVASAMLSAVYLLPIGFMAFFKENDEFFWLWEARLNACPHRCV